MSLRDRVPVEELSPEAWRHLEQRVVAHVGDAVATPVRRPWWPAVAALGGALAVAATLYAVRPSATQDAAPRPLTVEADARGAHVALGDAVIDAEPGTRFVVTRPDGGIRVELTSGAVALEVEPRRGRPPLWVVADDVTVTVVGTAFTVRRDADAVDVEVRHGVVQVERGDERVALHAGDRWRRGEGRLAARPIDPTTGGNGRHGPIGDGADPLAVGPGVDYDPLTGRHVAVVPPTAPSTGPDRGRDPARPSRPRPTPPTPVVVDPVRDLRRELAVPSLGAAPPSAASNSAEALELFQRASVTERGTAAAAALWGLARTQWTVGKKVEALRSVDAYLRRFPNGAESDAVSWLRLRLLCDRGFDEPCRAAAHTYADRTSDATRRALALRITDTR